MELLRIIGVHFLIGLGISFGVASIPVSCWGFQAYRRWRERRLEQYTAWHFDHLEALAQIHRTR